MKTKSFFAGGIESYNKFSCQELLDMLNQQENLAKKVPFIITLSAKCNSETRVINILLEQASNQENQNTIAMWGITVAMVAAMALIDIGTLADKVQLKQETDKWSADQRDDFLYYLKKEGVDL